MRVTHVPLPDVMRKYLKEDTFNRDGKTNRYKTHCPFHADSSPSMVLFDKTDTGNGWDYHCFVCGAHGTAVSMLVEKKLVENEDAAIERLMEDFGVVLPDVVTVESLCEYKGLDATFARKQGWKDTKEGVSIPFLDRNGDVLFEKIRHKFAGKDKYYYKNSSDGLRVQTTPYGLHWLDAYADDVLYIAEGETDCMTLRQAGFPAIGIAGTNGFQDSFVPYIDRFKSLVVVRDTDEAGWRLVMDVAEQFPDRVYMMELPGGNKDVNNFHLHRCGGDLKTFAKMFGAIATLPASPETFITAVQQGSVAVTEGLCWDMVMRYYKTNAERLVYKELFAKETKTPKTIIAACMKTAHKPEVAPADATTFDVADGCYYKTYWRGDVKVRERITNFVIQPTFDVQGDGEIIRVCDLVSNTGKVARGIRFDSETLATSVKFNARCLAAGDFIFTGQQEDLFQMCYTIFNVPKRTVHSPRRIGRLETGGWLFGNCGIDSTGTLVPMEDDLVMLDGVAYSPRAVTIDDGGDSSSADMPMFDLPALDKVEQPDYMKRTAELLEATFGNPSVLLGLGWVVAGWYSDDIFDHFGFYPYLFITGKRSSGKSVLGTLLQTSYGFSAATAGMSIETPTNVGISRYLTYRASLPQWYDDYRNDVRRIQQKDGLLLDIYNRHGAVKGRRSAGDVRKESINGFLLLSGEDTPSNNALLTRCVVVTLSAHTRNADKYQEAEDLMSLMPLAGLSWAADATKGGFAAMLPHIARMRDKLFEATRDARYAANHAIFLGAFLYAFGMHISTVQRDRLIEHVCKFCVQETIETNADHPVAQFFNDLVPMAERGLITLGRDFTVHDFGTHAQLGIRTANLHRAWCDYRKREPLSYKSLRGYMKQEAFFVGEERWVFEEAGRQRCDVLSILRLSEEFEDLTSYVEHVTAKPSF